MDDSSEKDRIWESEDEPLKKPFGFENEPVPLDPKEKLKFAQIIMLGAAILLVLAALLLFISSWLRPEGDNPYASKIWDYISELVKVVVLLIIGSYFSSKRNG